jgi:hypothetical protein
MSNNRIWILGTVVISIAVLVLGWFLGLQPRLAEAAAASAERVSVEQQNAARANQIEKLKSDFAGLDAVAAELQSLRESLPASADYTGFLNQLNDIAKENSATLTAFAPAAPVVLGDPAGLAASQAEEASGSAGSGAGASEEPTGTELPDGSLVAIPTTLSASADFDDLLSFVGDLQHGTRLFLVSGLDFAGEDKAYTVSITGYVYVVIDSSVTDPDAAVSETAPTEMPTPTAVETTTGPQPSSTPESSTPKPSSTPESSTPKPSSTPESSTSSTPTPSTTPKPSTTPQ